MAGKGGSPDQSEGDNVQFYCTTLKNLFCRGMWVVPIVVLGVLAVISLCFAIYSPLPQRPWWQLGTTILATVFFSNGLTPIMLRIRFCFGLASAKDLRLQNLWPPILIGYCEAVIYPLAMLLCAKEFVAVWLALKVAGQWGMWVNGKHRARNRYQMFLIGNALSLCLGLCSYCVIRIFILTEALNISISSFWPS